MSLPLAGQLAGMAFAAGLDLYLTVAVLGVLSRTGLLELPIGLQGLESNVVIASALALYVVEAVVDKIDHADSVWNALHTFIRPPAAALLAIGATWDQPVTVMAAGSLGALAVAFAAHTGKSGFRMTLNAYLRTRHKPWISAGEDLLAAGLAVAAALYPEAALAAVAVALAIGTVVGPRLWRAHRFGSLCLVAWLRAIFVPARWREAGELPAPVRRIVGEAPLGAAPVQGARAAIDGLDRVGSFRNGWLVLTPDGPAFIFPTLFGHRRVDLPQTREVRAQQAVWAHVLSLEETDEERFTLFLLKDGPDIDLATSYLSTATT